MHSSSTRTSLPAHPHPLARPRPTLVVLPSSAPRSSSSPSLVPTRPTRTFPNAHYRVPVPWQSEPLWTHRRRFSFTTSPPPPSLPAPFPSHRRGLSFPLDPTSRPFSTICGRNPHSLKIPLNPKSLTMRWCLPWEAGEGGWPPTRGGRGGGGYDGTVSIP